MATAQHPLSSEFLPLPDASHPVASNEAERLRQLSRSNLLDSPANPTLDRIARLAATATESPVAIISVLSARRSWFKAKVGLDDDSAPRAWALCNYTVMQSGLFTVPDTLADARFSGNPLVLGAPFIRAYAGVPLHDEHGWRIGALCVIDRKPRVATAAAASVLADLASLAMDELRREAHPARHG